jgi:hypothetical protein
MKRYILQSVLVSSVLFFGACTDLEVEETDSKFRESASGEFGGTDPEARIQAIYNGFEFVLHHEQAYAMMEVTSDEAIVPTRGGDWGDNGVWRSLHTHSWTPSHIRILAAWNELNQRVFAANELLADATLANFNRTPQQTAEGKFLRAIYMFYILDFWGQVPFREVGQGPDEYPSVLNAQEAFDFIVQDLTDALPGLPAVGPTGQTNRASKAAANFLLAKLYLNKHVFLNNAEPQAEDMTKVINYVNAIAADGFDLHDDYFDIFRTTPDSETILWARTNQNNKIWNTLHYRQGNYAEPGGGWNGFSATAELYDLFEGPANDNSPGAGQEERRGFVPTDGEGYGFLIGQQYNINGETIETRQGTPLAYTKEFNGLVGNGEANGIRVLKYHPTDNYDPVTGEGGGDNLYVIMFRYADAHLMKIEAILRGGQSSDDPLTLYNQLRTIREASTVSSVSLDDILDERARELYWEGWRRQDQIRFGTFDETWTLKTNTEEFRRLFPIPARAIASNPNLVQNEGY